MLALAAIFLQAAAACGRGRGGGGGCRRGCDDSLLQPHSGDERWIWSVMDDGGPGVSWRWFEPLQASSLLWFSLGFYCLFHSVCPAFQSLLSFVFSFLSLRLPLHSPTRLQSVLTLQLSLSHPFSLGLLVLLVLFVCFLFLLFCLGPVRLVVSFGWSVWWLASFPPLDSPTLFFWLVFAVHFFGSSLLLVLPSHRLIWPTFFSHPFCRLWLVSFLSPCFVAFLFLLQSCSSLFASLFVPPFWFSSVFSSGLAGCLSIDLLQSTPLVGRPLLVSSLPDFSFDQSSLVVSSLPAILPSVSVGQFSLLPSLTSSFNLQSWSSLLFWLVSPPFLFSSVLVAFSFDWTTFLPLRGWCFHLIDFRSWVWFLTIDYSWQWFILFFRKWQKKKEPAEIPLF